MKKTILAALGNMGWGGWQLERWAKPVDCRQKDIYLQGRFTLRNWITERLEGRTAETHQRTKPQLCVYLWCLFAHFIMCTHISCQYKSLMLLFRRLYASFCVIVLLFRLHGTNIFCRKTIIEHNRNIFVNSITIIQDLYSYFPVNGEHWVSACIHYCLIRQFPSWIRESGNCEG